MSLNIDSMNCSRRPTARQLKVACSPDPVNATTEALNTWNFQRLIDLPTSPVDFEEIQFLFMTKFGGWEVQATTRTHGRLQLCIRQTPCKKVLYVPFRKAAEVMPI